MASSLNLYGAGGTALTASCGQLVLVRSPIDKASLDQAPVTCVQGFSY